MRSRTLWRERSEGTSPAACGAPAVAWCGKELHVWDREVFAAPALGFEADLAERFGIGQGTAVEDRQFEVVDFDDDVVDAGAEKRGEQVLRGGDEHALAHEAGGVADFGDVTPDGGNIEAIEVGTAKDDAATGRSGQKLHANGRAA